MEITEMWNGYPTPKIKMETLEFLELEKLDDSECYRIVYLYKYDIIVVAFTDNTGVTTSPTRGKSWVVNREDYLMEQSDFNVPINEFRIPYLEEVWEDGEDA